MKEIATSVISFPASFTAEEVKLKGMFEKLKSIRRAIAAAKSGQTATSREEVPKAERRTSVKRSIEEAEVTTEEVKRKVMAGAIIVNKVQSKQTFKRAKLLDKKHKDSDSVSSPTVFQPYSQSVFGDFNNDAPAERPERKPKRSSGGQPSLYDSFVGGGSLNDDDRPARAGNTLFVRAFDLTEDPLRKAFEKFGVVVRVELEDSRRRSAFVTFESPEAAEKALKEMDGNMVNGITLKVSYAKRQDRPWIRGTGRASAGRGSASRRPSSPPTSQPASQHAWANMAADATSTARKREDSRSLVTYDDADTFS
uniref:Negative elongation factor E n=1 Tax=Plectus sambesii TaxID=2011161 RepID=A0A914WEE5_9BILA